MAETGILTKVTKHLKEGAVAVIALVDVSAILLAKFTTALGAKWGLALLFGLTLIFAPVLLWRLIRAQWAVRIVLLAAMDIFLCLLFSIFGATKPLSLPGSVVRRPELRERIRARESPVLRDQEYNVVTFQGPPDIGILGRELQVAASVTWVKMDRIAGFEIRRGYMVELLLSCAYEGELDGEFTVSPLQLEDYSVAPHREWFSYLFSWLEGPVMMMERQLVLEPLRERLETSLLPEPS